MVKLSNCEWKRVDGLVPSDRIKRQIDTLLDEAEEALKALKGDVVRERALAVLALDEGNQDAEAYLKAADSMLGKTTSRSKESSPPPMETCQIEYSTTSSFLGYPSGNYYFWANAASPYDGQYAACCSPYFKPGLTQAFRNWATKVNDFNPQSWDKNAAQAHGALVNLLLREGWEPSQFRGHQWWQHSFQRPVRRFEDGWLIVHTVKKWNGYWACDSSAKIDDNPMFQKGVKVGKVRVDREGIWVEEQYFVESSKENGWSMVSIIPSFHDTHMVTMK